MQGVSGRSVGQGEVVEEEEVEMVNKSNRLEELISVIFYDSQESNHVTQLDQLKVLIALLVSRIRGEIHSPVI